MTRWDAELAYETWQQIRRQYKRTYRLRHPKRLHAMQRVYKARWKAKQLGLQPPPLPDWDKELGGFEVHFNRGTQKGSLANSALHHERSSLLLPSTFPSSTEQIIYSNSDANPLPNAHNNSSRERASQALNKGSGRGRKTGGYRNGEGHVFPRCRLCGRSFRRFKSQIVQPGDGSFCSICGLALVQ
jgi:hypothetical protein